MAKLLDHDPNDPADRPEPPNRIAVDDSVEMTQGRETCAVAITVLSCIRRSSASRMASSESLSNAEVASSSQQKWCVFQRAGDRCVACQGADSDGSRAAFRATTDHADERPQKPSIETVAHFR
jgi:hypothetical protein